MIVRVRGGIRLWIGLLPTLRILQTGSVLAFWTPHSLHHHHHHHHHHHESFHITQPQSQPQSPLFSSSSSSSSETDPLPPLITFHRTTPLHSSTYEQVLSTTTLRPIALKLRQFYDDHFCDPRQPNAKRFHWDPWYVTIGDGTTRIDSLSGDDDDNDGSVEHGTDDGTPSTIRLEGELQSASYQTQYSLKRIQTSTFFTGGGGATNGNNHKEEEEKEEDDEHNEGFVTHYDELIEGLTTLGRSIGLSSITPPWTSLYTDGDMQNWHTDTDNGPMAFVLSLCSDDVRFEGGETMLLRPEVLDFWRGSRGLVDRGLEGGDIVRYIPPTPLGRCIAFDPRVPHGVNRVITSSHDPRHARVVIHGWFSQPETCWFGPWGYGSMDDVEEANRRLEDALVPLVETLGSGEIGRVLGYLAVRCDVDRYGCVEDVVAVCDTMQADMDDFRGVIGYDEEEREVKEDAVADLRLTIYEALKGLTFGDDDDDNDEKNTENDNSEEMEGVKGRSVVIPFAFE